MSEQAAYIVPEHLKQLVGETAEQYRDRMLMAWDASKKALEVAKEQEMELRKHCAVTMFPNAEKGTNRIALGNGYALKMVRKVDYSFTGKTREEIAAAETAVARIGNQGAFLADRLFKWSCEPSVSEYNKLDLSLEEHRLIKAEIDKVMTTKDGAPTLAIEEPKAKKG